MSDEIVPSGDGTAVLVRVDIPDAKTQVRGYVAIVTVARIVIKIHASVFIWAYTKMLPKYKK